MRLNPLDPDRIDRFPMGFTRDVNLAILFAVCIVGISAGIGYYIGWMLATMIFVVMCVFSTPIWKGVEHVIETYIRRRAEIDRIRTSANFVLVEGSIFTVYPFLFSNRLETMKSYCADNAMPFQIHFFNDTRIVVISFDDDAHAILFKMRFG